MQQTHLQRLRTSLDARLIAVFVVTVLLALLAVNTAAFLILRDQMDRQNATSLQQGQQTAALLLALGATAVAICLAVPLVLYLHAYAGRSRFADWLRLTLDIMWGIPSIVYGAFGFSLMIFLGLRASLLAGVIALSFVVLPILARTFDEVVSMAPKQLQETGFALGTTRLEMAGLLLRQSLPGLFTAILLAFGRGIGDAAAVLFTAGYTDNMPSSVMLPVASLPLAVFFQLGTPFPSVQERAYASALVLTVIILVISLVAHLSMRRLGKHVVR
jgi:phosphate transport system permease protein